MLNRVYCTYFDENYLSRGVAMYHSLRRHVPDARLWVLCLSDACHNALLKLDLPPEDATKLRSVRHYNGLPIDARSVTDELVMQEGI